MRPPARLLVPVFVAGLLASACTAAGPLASGPGASTSPGAGASASPQLTNAPKNTPSTGPAGSYQLPADPNALVMRIDTAGGLIAPGYLLTHIAQFNLYADGRVIVPGPVIAIYPAPLLPNLRVWKLSADEVQRLLGAAAEAGLLGPDASYDARGVMDAGTTTFTTTVNGKTHRISAYALGIGSDGLLSPDDVAARQKLADFAARVTDLKTPLGNTPPDVAYEAAGLRVFVAAPVKPEPPMTQQVLTWPLAVDPKTAAKTHIQGTGCLLLAGNDAAAFVKVAQTANMLTSWKAASGSYSLQVRPLLPDESGCTA